MPCLRAQAEVARGPGRELIVRHQCAVVVARHGRARAQAHLVGQLRAAQRLACTSRAGALVRRFENPLTHQVLQVKADLQPAEGTVHWARTNCL